MDFKKRARPELVYRSCEQELSTRESTSAVSKSIVQEKGREPESLDDSSIELDI